MKLTVQPGDTLGRLTQLALQQAGPDAAPSSPPFSALMKKVQAVAAENQIRNPDRIFAGQVIDFSTLFAPAEMQAPVAAITDQAQQRSPHRLLEQTLTRAVARGFMPQEDLPAVRRQILDMSRQYGFQPDDLARVALIESDGFNPKASNGNCHGVIQFCNGDGRGAASVGYGKNPREILSLSVREQLTLVDQYFQDTGLKNYRAPSLETLYLTVLFPAARDERQINKPLPIPGPQAAVLHVGGNQAAPITRASLRKGLIDNASVRLAQFAQEQARQQTRIARQEPPPVTTVTASVLPQEPTPHVLASTATPATPNPTPPTVASEAATRRSVTADALGSIPRMPALLPNFSVPSVSTQSVLYARQSS